MVTTATLERAARPAPLQRVRWVALEALIPDRCFADARYCDPEHFPEWERWVAEHALAVKGWKVQEWRTGEGDRFGPLTRYAVAFLGDEMYRIVYG